MISNHSILQNMLFNEKAKTARPTFSRNCELLTGNDIKILLYLVEHFLDESPQKDTCTVFQFDKKVISKETGFSYNEVTASLNKIKEIEIHSPNASLIKNNRENLLHELVFDEDDNQFVVLDLSEFVYDSLMEYISLSKKMNQTHLH